MAIGMAQQKGYTIYVYDENNNQLWTRSGGELQGYTSSIVTIKVGSTLYMYDEKGNQTGSRPC